MAFRLRWIQRYFAKGITAPPCEFIESCCHRAVGMWVDKNGRGHDLCEWHAKDMKAEPMQEGICYAPTGD